jgi:hypothetical protein
MTTHKIIKNYKHQICHTENIYLYIKASINTFDNKITLMYLLTKNLLLPKKHIQFDNISSKLRFNINNNATLHVIITNNLYNPDLDKYKIQISTFDNCSNYIKCFLNCPGLKYEIKNIIYNVNFTKKLDNILIRDMEKMTI